MGVYPINNVVISFRWTVKELSHTCTCVHSPPNSPPIQAADNIEKRGSLYLFLKDKVISFILTYNKALTKLYHDDCFNFHIF